MQKYAWKILFGLMAIVISWFAVDSLYKLYIYARVNTAGKSSEIQWSVKELSEERYIIHADFSFHSQGNLFHGDTDFLEIGYKNKWAAENAIKEFSKRNWVLWYSPSNPSYATLERSFPLKEGISTLLLIAVFLYFIGLQYYISHVNK